MTLTYSESSACPSSSREVVEHCESFNIEEKEPRVLKQDGMFTFGYRVTGFVSSEKWVIASAPLAVNRTGARTGRVFRCLYASKSCQELAVHSPPEAGDISLGLSLDVSQGRDPRILACGPTLSHRCGSNMYQNGVCYLFDQNFQHTARIPSKTRDCFTARVDLAFLIDGSTSIVPDDFSRMKDFLIAMLRRFRDRDVQFSMLQFSHLMKKEFTFLEYHWENQSEDLIRRIRQIKGDTYTPTAIKRAVEDLFTADSGLRNDSSRVLVVITDGMSNDPDTLFSEAVRAAEAKHIFRLAVGVGPEFQSAEGRRELAIIASNSSEGNVFSIENYDALASIQDRLQHKIFSIEGTKGMANASSFQMELSQEGFSCLLPREGAVLGSVGSYGWSGGILLYQGSRETFLNVSNSDFKDSYLGYSVQVATRAGKTFYVAGAPRHRHRGEVVIFRKGSSALWEVSQQIPGEQVGGYFGAELCVLDLGGDGDSDLLLVGAPMYHQPDRGGKVDVCSLSQEGRFSCTATLWGARGGGLGRFGSSLAPLRDLDGDGLTDVAVGAPLEDGHGGSVYIFLGTDSGVRPAYSQRLTGSRVSPDLKYFGTSVSGRVDVTGDGLTDLVVGGAGAVVVFRSRPVVDVNVWFTFEPPRVPRSLYLCPWHTTSSLPAMNASLCFNLTKVTADTLGDPRGAVNYTLLLEPDRQAARVFLPASGGRLEGRVQLGGRGRCLPFVLLFPNCVQDYFQPILLLVNFTLDAEEGSEGLRPALNDRRNTTQFGKLYLERDCRLGRHCPDYLRVVFNFSGGDELVVGRDSLLRVQVSLENAGDDSYEVGFQLYHPDWLNFKRVVSEQTGSAPVHCRGETKGVPEEAGTSICLMKDPIFLQGSRVTFEAEFDATSPAIEESSVNFTIITTSQSPHRIKNESSLTRWITLRYAVDISVAQLNFTRHVGFTERRQEVRVVKHTYQVKNSGRRPLPVTVTFTCPAGSGTVPLWNAMVSERGQKHIATCLKTSRKHPSVQRSSNDFTESDLLPGCGIGLCLEVVCQVRVLSGGAAVIFDMEGAVTGSAVAEQQRGDRLGLWSTAQLEFDQTRYADRSQAAARYRQATVVTEIEVSPDVSWMPLAVGGSLGGVVLLLLVALGLYKFGFFRRPKPDDTSDPGGAALPHQEEGPSAEADPVGE